MSLNELAPKPEPKPTTKRSLELRKRPQPTFGGLPTVSLLPRELRTAARERAIRRYLVMGVATALVAAAAAVAGATAMAGAAQGRLDAANQQTQMLAGQLGKFRDVQLLQQNLALGNAAVDVATSTEIDWQAQFAAIRADMPQGYTITSLQTDSATISSDYNQGTSPLDKPRAATVQVSVAAHDVTLLPRWLRLLRSMPAYADATASVLSDGSNGYTVQIVLHLSPKALVSAAGKAAK